MKFNGLEGLSIASMNSKAKDQSFPRSIEWEGFNCSVFEQQVTGISTIYRL